MATAVENTIQDLLTKAASQILQQRAALGELLRNGRIFTEFDPVDDISRNQKKTITQPLWTDGSTLTTFFTSSDQSTFQKRWFYQVLQEVESSITSEPQFTVAWGHAYGSGSDTGNSGILDYPTKAIYSQYKQLFLPNDSLFTFQYGSGSEHIYVINVNRGRFKEKVQPGTIEFHLSPLNGDSYANNVFTGSNVSVNAASASISLIDDSTLGSAVQISDVGRVYNIVSGSLNGGIVSNDSNSYGLFYPDYGVIVLNGKTLDRVLKFNSVTGSGINGDNAYKLYKSLSGSAAYNTSSFGFTGAAAETVSSTYYYVRVKNGEYNFSTNPSFVTGSNGDLRQVTFVDDPKTYVTSIGMYNDNNELLAIAKLNKPVMKAFDREVLINVRLDY